MEVCLSLAGSSEAIRQMNDELRNYLDVTAPGSRIHQRSSKRTHQVVGSD